MLVLAFASGGVAFFTDDVYVVRPFFAPFFPKPFFTNFAFSSASSFLRSFSTFDFLWTLTLNIKNNAACFLSYISISVKGFNSLLIFWLATAPNTLLLCM